MLHTCQFSGCKVMTLGEYCIDHESGPQRPPPPPPRATKGASAGCLRTRQPTAIATWVTRWRGAVTLDVRAFDERASGDACRRDDPAFDGWIRASYGFRVRGPNGRVGTVKGHLYDSSGSLEALVVCSGLIRPRTLEVPVDAIEWVLPQGRRLLLASDLEPR
jgi:hypothetical protein